MTIGNRPRAFGLGALGLLCLAGSPATGADGEATVESVRSRAEACKVGDCVVLTWEGLVSNKTLGELEASLRLVISDEAGSQVTAVDLGTLTLDRMESRLTSAVLEVDAATWERVYSIRAEVGSTTRLSDPRVLSPGSLIPDVRSQDEKAGDIERQREQLRAKIERLQREYDERRTDYELVRAKIGPFGLLDTESDRGRRLERDLERAAKRMQDAAADLREAQGRLRDLR